MSRSKIRSDNNIDDILFLTQVAVLRYRFGYKQNDIAKRMNVSTMTISRILDRAQKIGIVEIKINSPIVNEEELEKVFLKKFPIKRAFITRVGKNRDIIEETARAAAFYVDTVISPGMYLGIAGGYSITRIVPYLKLGAIKKKEDLTVVQLMGGFSQPGPYNPITTIHELMHRFSINVHFHTLPIYAPSRKSVLSFKNFKNVIQIEELWKKCEVAIASVGSIGEASSLLQHGVISKEEMNVIAEKGGVGDLLGYWYDINGKFLDIELNERSLGIPLSLYRSIPTKIIFAIGTEKVKALMGIMRTGMIDTVITDSRTAEKIKDFY